LTILQDIHKMCWCSSWLFCRVSTKCVYVFHLTSAGCPGNVLVCSIWLSCWMSTKCVYVFNFTFLQDIYKMCLYFPPDNPTWC
jgi:hypothetical protein